MTLQWIGAVLIVVGCGGTGFSMAAHYKREEAALRQLIRALEFMICELEYRLTPLPDLCRRVAQFSTGAVAKTFSKLATELEAQIAPDAASCMRAALAGVKELPSMTGQAMLQLGLSLGRFDVQGQRASLQQVQEDCREKVRHLVENKSSRIRCYQTLGL